MHRTKTTHENGLKWTQNVQKFCRQNPSSYLNWCETVRMHPIKTTHIPVIDYTYTMILHAVWNAHVESDGSTVRMCHHFLPHTSKHGLTLSYLYLWATVDISLYELRALFCHYMLVTNWTNREIKILKWKSILCK